MTQFKKKSGNVTSIADEVAALHGLTKSTMRPLTKSVFAALVNQLFEKGSIRIPGLGSWHVEMSIRSGTPRTFVRLRPHKYVRDRVRTILSNPENLDFVNYLLQRDEGKQFRREKNRIKELEYAGRKKALRLGHERARVAAAIKATTGLDVDPATIAEEFVIRPLLNSPPSRGLHREERDLIAEGGVFPLEKLFLPSHLRGDTPSSPPEECNAPS